MDSAGSLRTLLTLCSIVTLGGCAASGREWVRAPEPGGFDGEQFTTELSAEPVNSESPALAGRPRLSRSITLGESFVTRGGERQPAPNQGGSIVVTVNNYVTPQTVVPYGVGFSGFSEPWDGGVRGQARARGPTPAVPALGGNWPAPRDSGPAFPYKTAPASPWAR